jgi:ABC-type antimicrobial peptide transport system permease subunit
VVGVIGFIALCLTFFLLMIATTSNIRDNIWEYGVLRSMGVTMKEGTRVYLYEAYMVILASGIIGLVIGIIGACLVTS